MYKVDNLIKNTTNYDMTDWRSDNDFNWPFN